MLQQLTIKNIALIDELHLEFNAGFNVLSGETGAGKSIIIDALNLVLGERADKELVRTGTQKARVEGIFCVDNNIQVAEILSENEIECEDGLLIVVREISVDGKSICRINGNAVTLSVLKRIADKLADIHGQHEHQLLLNKETHLDFLDSFGGTALLLQKENVRIAHTYYKTCVDKLNGDWGTQEERNDRIEMLEFQIDEIEKAEISVGQEEELKNRAEILKNADKIKETIEETIKSISSNALDEIRNASKAFSKVLNVDEQYEVIYNRLENVFYELEDIEDELNNQINYIEADPYELEQIEDRLGQLKKLYRKYGNNEEAVLKYYDDACTELEKLINAEKTIAELEKQAEHFKTEYFKEANKLSELRHDAAIAFEDRIKSELADLGMKNATLEVDFNDNASISNNGYDVVEFLFSANTGEPVKPLSKIISGGEMSRFMLAMKSVAADDIMLPTMVFDEIDTGISGNGAQVVAEKIANLSDKHQVIAITHLPQIASMADSHFLIKKYSDAERTHTEVVLMDYIQRKREIARLSGGVETDLAIKRAEEILQQAENYKKRI